MATAVYRDKNCSKQLDERMDPFKHTFSQLKSKCQNDDKLYYKQSPNDTACHELTISGLGFHLGHEDKFHECSSDNSLIAACIVGDLSAELRDTLQHSSSVASAPSDPSQI